MYGGGHCNDEYERMQQLIALQMMQLHHHHQFDRVGRWVVPSVCVGVILWC